MKFLLIVRFMECSSDCLLRLDWNPLTAAFRFGRAFLRDFIVFSIPRCCVSAVHNLLEL